MKIVWPDYKEYRDRVIRQTAPATTYTMKVTANLFWAAVLAAALLSSCAYNETTNNFTINGDSNTLPTTQTSTTERPTSVDADLAGSAYGAVTSAKE